MKYTYELSKELKKFIAGDVGAFENFYYMTVNEVYYHAVLVTKDAEESKKVMIRIYKEFFVRLKRMNRPEDFSELADSIIYTALTDWVASKCMRLMVQEEGGKFDTIERLPEIEYMPPKAVYSDTETAGLVADFITELNSLHALTGLAYYYDKLDGPKMSQYLQSDLSIIDKRIDYIAEELKAHTEDFAKERRIEIKKIDIRLILLAYTVLSQNIIHPDADELYERIVEALS